MFPAFSGVGTPQNLIAALHRQRAKSLTGISNGHGGIDGRVDLGTLAERIRAADARSGGFLPPPA